MTRSAFGERLRTLRRQHKLTQQAVADLLNIHRSTYTKYETGSVAPDQQGLVVLAETFGVTVDYLFGREEAVSSSVANDSRETTSLTEQELVMLQMFRQLTQEEQEHLVRQAQRAFKDYQKNG